jgi:iron complex transport system substrate-binding protein
MTKTTERPGFVLPGVEDITRRDFLVGGAAAILLGGCGSSGGGSEASGRTKPFEHAMGTSEVPVSPRRVVALGDLLIFDPLVQLGVTPVGVIETQNTLNDAEDVEKVGAQAEPNLEAIAALEPDLIVGESWHPGELYERLSRIAPTVFAPDYLGEDALDRHRFIADLVGRTDRFEELVAQYESRVEEIRGRLGPISGALEVSPLNPYAEEDAVYVYREESFGGVKVLADLGIALSKGVRGLPGDGSVMPAVSFELIPKLDADVIFALYDPRSDESEREAFRSSPLLDRTFAARNDQVFEVNSDPWYAASVLALNLVLDDIERYLLERQIDTSGDFR